MRLHRAASQRKVTLTVAAEGRGGGSGGGALHVFTSNRRMTFQIDGDGKRRRRRNDQQNRRGGRTSLWL